MTTDLNIQILYKDALFDFQVEKFMTFEQLMEQIEFLVGIPLSDQYFKKYPNVELHASISSRGVSDGDILEMIEKPVKPHELIDSIDLTDDIEVSSIDFQCIVENTCKIKGVSNQFFYCGPFDKAFDASRRESKILMNILYSDHDEKSISFVNRILTNSSFLSQYLSPNYIVWVSTIENFTNLVSLQRMIERNGMVDQLTPKSLPMTSFIAYFEKSISVLDIIEGTIEDVGLESKLIHLFEAFGPILKESVKNVEKSHIGVLRDEQDDKFNESLKKDQEKTMILERQRDLERIEKQKLDDLAMRGEREKVERIQSLPEEPGSGEKDITTIAFRLMDGSRLQRRFKTSEPISHLFIFLESKSLSNVDLVLNFPKKTYTAQMNSSIASDSNLFPQAMLYVKEKE